MLFNPNPWNDRQYLLICTDFEEAKKAIWKEMYKHYQRDSEEPSITREIKALTVNRSKIKETSRGNIRLLENVGKDFLRGYIYSRLNPLDSIVIIWFNPKEYINSKPLNSHEINGEKVDKIIIVGQDSLKFYLDTFKLVLKTRQDVEIKVEV